MYRDRKITVIIPAAGSGKRMNAGPVNKVYMKLLGETVISRTVGVFENNELVDRIIVAVREDELEFCKENILKQSDHPKLTDIISGGAERCDTVFKALQLADPEDIVLVHDGARPLIADDTVTECIKTTADKGCCAAGVPVKDTIKVIRDDYYADTPDRSTLYAIHTPQAFICKDIREWMKTGMEQGMAGTDESVFAEKQGKKVFIVKDKYDNIKITTSEDIIIAEAILMRRNSQE